MREDIRLLALLSESIALLDVMTNAFAYLVITSPAGSYVRPELHGKYSIAALYVVSYISTLGVSSTMMDICIHNFAVHEFSSCHSHHDHQSRIVHCRKWAPGYQRRPSSCFRKNDGRPLQGAALYYNDRAKYG